MLSISRLKKIVLINVGVVFLQVLFLIFPFASFTLAQSTNTAAGVNGAATMGVAHMVDIKGKDIKDGSVVSTSPTGALLSIVPYDSQVLGIVSRDAAIILSTTDSPNAVPVIANGTVYVLVSSEEGPIKKGDLLTTSKIPGVAVKATNNGYVLGSALEDFNSPSAKQIGKIAIDLDLHYFNAKPTLAGTLTDILKFVLLPVKDSPAPFWKYMAAGAVVLASFILTFMTFGRTAAKGVEALGRNPAASKIIHLGIIFNVGICVVITIVGLVVAFLILRL